MTRAVLINHYELWSSQLCWMQEVVRTNKVDGPNAEKIRRAKLKLYSDIPYLNNETTKHKTYLPMQPLIYQPTLRCSRLFTSRLSKNKFPARIVEEANKAVKEVLVWPALLLPR